MRFRPGDIVRMLANAGYPKYVGFTAVVDRQYYHDPHDCEYVDVTWIDRGPSDGGYHPQGFELVSRAATTPLQDKVLAYLDRELNDG